MNVLKRQIDTKNANMKKRKEKENMKNTLEIMKNELETLRNELKNMENGTTQVHAKRMEEYATVITSDPENIEMFENMCVVAPSHYSKVTTYINDKQVKCNVYKVPKSSLEFLPGKVEQQINTITGR